MDSLFLEQFRKASGKSVDDTDLKELILLKAPKNKKQEDLLTDILQYGFHIDDMHYVRYGKSSSQGKDGITLFVEESVYDYLFESSQLGVQIFDCVISKYEAQRNLTLSTCKLIQDSLPYIVVVDEYTKVLEDQYIRYVVEKPKNIIDKNTNEEKVVNIREVAEGYHDITLSPFDGCGCHSHEMSEKWSNILGLDYVAAGCQIRLPLMKGYSVEVPFKDIFQSMGATRIKDVFGNYHNIEDIDCIWNVSMWKGYGIFKENFGDNGFIEYINRLNKYGYHLGITKYSHHVSHINIKTRMNFQYLQCLDLWNPKYIEWFCNGRANKENYDILDNQNDGKIIDLARYTTDMYEKIIKGDKFYSYKYLGLDDTGDFLANSNYVEAVGVNDIMLKDPAIKGFIYRKLQKSIEQAKYGKIYVDGFYHTCIGDMIGYLEFCAGLEPKGLLKAGEFYCDTIPTGEILSFRSPLVCPSEVNKVNVVSNSKLKKWFSHLKDQDIVMVNMYDLSLPQQGGADMDGDALLLCHEQMLVDTKIDKPVIIDIDDKISSKKKSYTEENIIEYELNSRDNRIGEITNVATCILNQYTNDEYWNKVNYDNISLLRVMQGKEIDSIKTGIRWHMTSYLRKCGKKLPYFMLYRYPEKLKRYYALMNKNKKLAEDRRYEPNAYHSPSPLNELCDYILTWEKKKIKWDNSYIDTTALIIDNSLDLSDNEIIRQIRKLLNQFVEAWRDSIRLKAEFGDINVNNIIRYYTDELFKIVPNRTLLANYCIKVSYSNMSKNKSLVWQMFGDVIISNLKKNSPPSKRTRIVETQTYSPVAKEFLGKYYLMIEGDTYI